MSKIIVTRDQLNSYIKSWVNQNLCDGDDRSGAIKDSYIFNGESLYEMFEEVVEDVIEEFSDE